MRDLKGRLVLVTGGARGIGRATVWRFLEEGARVIVADVDRAAAEETTRALSTMGTVIAAALDVTDKKAFAELVARIEAEHGPIDVLVNNAGIMSLGSFLGHDDAMEKKELDINLFGVLNGMRAVIPSMQARARGHIVNVASLAGRVGIPNATAYSASKFAVIGATESVRNELRGSGIEFTYVMPYLVKTELAAGTRALPWPAPVEPEDVARALVDAVKKNRLEVYVPRISRLTAMLPQVLPRDFVDWVGAQLGLNGLFKKVDGTARAAYLARTGASPAAPASSSAPKLEPGAPATDDPEKRSRLRVLN